MYSQPYTLENTTYSHQPHYPPPTLYQQPKEPLPSATDAKPNVLLTINELAEFSSTMVYLMWHARRQSVMDLHSSSKAGEDMTTDNPEQTRVTANAANMTSAAFKKFCRQILNATQLSESVVLLALKYIAMLLQNNPNIQGADGSEYRLFTVALMLGNKFLDDNTFTNKTWSEVSGMKVMDLNIMELEFLDVLKFKLSICKEEYERWRTALFMFRHQLIHVPVEDPRQKLMETMALSVNQQQQQQQQQQVQWIRHQNKIAHNSHLFSKPQYQFPIQTMNGPINRVQLRIPRNPIYNQSNTPVTMATPAYDNSIPTYTTNTTIRRPQDNYPSYHTQPINTPFMNNRTSSLQPKNGYYGYPDYNPYNTPTNIPPRPLPLTPQKKYSGPIPEDPLTVVDSYRMNY